MSFNAEKSEHGRPMQGGKNIEAIEWNQNEKTWDFYEVSNVNNKITVEKNPRKCALCHSGAPKMVDLEHADHYRTKMKPIFAQYPFWPGFYGSINDIYSPNGIGGKLKASMGHIEDLLFDDSEELAKLRVEFDSNEAYRDLVQHEVDVHNNELPKFLNSYKTLPRYRHLLTHKDLYQESERTPSFLDSSPFRTSFAKVNGHYLFRPNFYLSTLLTFRHAEYIAQEILNFKEYHKMKYSFLAAKYNCGPQVGIKVKGLALKDLNDSFDLIYPNVADEKKSTQQYLKAYQYNITSKANLPPLPLHAWNLEFNEKIGSYHYGNVFADLNELVLWKLLKEAMPKIKNKDGKSGAEYDHYILTGDDYFKRNLDNADGFVSRFTTSQHQFAITRQRYYRMGDKRYKGLPVSRHCKKIVAKAKQEMSELALLAEKSELPHQIYQLDQVFDIAQTEQLSKESLTQNILPTSNTCSTCHSHASKPIGEHFKLHWNQVATKEALNKVAPWISRPNDDTESALIHKVTELTAFDMALPAPYGVRMPLGRTGMDFDLSNCFIQQVSSLAFEDSQEELECAEDDFSEECYCQNLTKAQEKLRTKFFPVKKSLKNDN
jgi:hypothetical protein